MTAEAIGTAFYNVYQPITAHQNPYTGTISYCAHAYVRRQAPHFSQARSSAKMAVGRGMLDDFFLHREVNKAVDCHSVQPVESQLSFPCHNNHWCSNEADGSYMVIVPKQGANVQLGLGQDEC